MELSWKRRLAIGASVLWILLWISGYLVDPYKDLRTSIFGVLVFGILPMTIAWLSWWVWSAFRAGRAKDN